MRGVEIDASLKLSSAFTISDRISFLDFEDINTGAALLYVPDIANVFRIDYVNDRHGIKGNVRIVSTGTQHISSTSTVSGYALVNCYISKSVSKYADLFAGVDNMFNYDATSSVYGNNEGAGMMGTCFYGGINIKL